MTDLINMGEWVWILKQWLSTLIVPLSLLQNLKPFSKYAIFEKFNYAQNTLVITNSNPGQIASGVPAIGALSVSEIVIATYKL